MFPIIQIGPIAIQSNGLILVLSFYLATMLITRTAPRFQLDTNAIEKYLLYSLIAGIIGARIGFILQYPSAFTGNWLNVFALNTALLDSMSGLLFGFICLAVLVNRWKIPLLLFLDALSTGALVMLGGIYLADFASGAHPGIVTQLPWGIYLAGALRHPVQIYEIVGVLLTGLYLWLLVIRNETDNYAGRLFFTFLSISSTVRIVLEIFHQPGELFLGNRPIQIVCFILLVGSFIGLDVVYSRSLVKSSEVTVKTDD